MRRCRRPRPPRRGPRPRRWSCAWQASPSVPAWRCWLADASCSVVHLYFSDPWPKARHHKRRVVQDA
ncbi:MAG: hypothetical protein ACKOFI_01485, partial [Phycisphaerales bacterium]